MRVNDCNFIGRLANDPEIYESKTGVNVCKFRLAVSGYRRESDPLFVDIKTYRSTADFAGKYLDKGDPVYISGELSIHRYQDDDGDYKWYSSINARNVVSLTSSRNKAMQSNPLDA